MSMQWQVETSGGQGPLIRVAGTITEEADFKPLIASAKRGIPQLDLEGIEEINSCGVREWIHFVKFLTDAAPGFELTRCSPAIVRQLNMISNFSGGGAIRSVMLPYYCAECGEEHHKLLELSPDAEGPPEVPDEIPCPVCGAPAEFDDLPDAYMRFLS